MKKGFIVISVLCVLFFSFFYLVNDKEISSLFQSTTNSETIEQSSCGKSMNTATSEYDILFVKYSKNNINITYPQIVKYKDLNKQNKTNELLKTNALKVLNLYKNAECECDLEIKSKVKYKSQNILSVQFFGMGSVKDSAYPNNLFYTTNIDLDTAKSVRLKDLVNIDQRFIDKFKTGNYQINNSSNKLRLEAAFNYILENNDDDMLKKSFEESDLLFETSSYTCCYLTKDYLGISIGVPHVIGEHVEFEFKLNELKNNFKEDFWNKLH